jgi:dethiobiotin synthetase/adenosylmethionine--8-amino-7-oxononanoate aminotransferase
MAFLRRSAYGLTSNRALFSGSSGLSELSLNPHHRVHLVFGANTDVGKSIVSAGLVRAAAVATASSRLGESVNYIKPLQCGGSDESFVMNHRSREFANINCQTLFSWKTPASPHLASRIENAPVSDAEVLSSLQASLRKIDETAAESGMHDEDDMRSITIIETAGGVLSPASSSPLNKFSHNDAWGWSTQADVYAPMNVPVVFVGDGKLGGISVSLASLEALWSRGYRVDALVFLEDGVEGSSIKFGRENATAVFEHITKPSNVQLPKSRPYDFELVCLPPLPQMPDPLHGWYERTEEDFQNLHDFLTRRWRRGLNDK